MQKQTPVSLPHPDVDAKLQRFIEANGFEVYEYAGALYVRGTEGEEDFDMGLDLFAAVARNCYKDEYEGGTAI